MLLTTISAADNALAVLITFRPLPNRSGSTLMVMGAKPFARKQGPFKRHPTAELHEPVIGSMSGVRPRSDVRRFLLRGRNGVEQGRGLIDTFDRRNSVIPIASGMPSA